MNSPSSHRLKKLQVYLYDQNALVEEILRSQPELRRNLDRQIRESPSAPARLAAETMDGRTPSQRLRANPPQIDSRLMGRSSDTARYGALGASPQNQHQQQLQNRSTMYTTSTMLDQPLEQYGPRVPRNPSPQTLQLDVRKGRGISSPGLLENASVTPGTVMDDLSEHLTPQNWQYPNGRFNDSDIDLGEIPTDTPVRPFSFAVWAGKNASRSGQGPYSARSSPGPRVNDSDPMNHRRTSTSGSASSIFGRWGGSVTSFFGGSQGGMSGSMMDMQCVFVLLPPCLSVLLQCVHNPVADVLTPFTAWDWKPIERKGTRLCLVNLAQYPWRLLLDLASSLALLENQTHGKINHQSDRRTLSTMAPRP